MGWPHATWGPKVHEEEGGTVKDTVDAIEIDGYKSIKHDTVALRRINILIGANGSGKSNFISLFKLANSIVEGDLQVLSTEEGGADTFFHQGLKATDSIKLRFIFGSYTYHCELSSTVNDSLFFREEGITYEAKEWSSLVFGKGHLESRLSVYDKTLFLAHPFAERALTALKGWRVYHFHDTSAHAKVKLTGDIEDHHFLKPDASNLAAFLYYLRERENVHYRRIVATIRLIAPFFDDFVLRPSRLREGSIRLAWKQRETRSEFTANQLSDGTLRFICLATLLLQPAPPATIVIDEPELGLHPYAIQVLSSLIRSASQKSQMIVSTQSVYLVDAFTPEDIIVVNHHNGASTFERLDTEALKVWLEEYSLGELWLKNVLGARPSL